MRRSLLSLCILLVMAATPIHVLAATYSTEVVNGISVGDINISIEESEGISENNFVLPGQKIEKRISIKNNANKAWVRAKLEYSDCGSFQGLSDEDIELASDDWIKIEDYYYCTTPLDEDATREFVKAIHIPSEWDSSRSNETFGIFTTVEAVQEANFTPDFSMANPWFGTIIESCVHTSYDAATEIGNKPFSVIFENGAEGLVKTGDDFFSNWPSLMPGDIVTDTVIIGNRYSRPVTIFFRAENISDDELISKVNLVIKNGNDTLYDGAMNGDITKEINLGSIKQGETKTLTYTVSIPESLTNEFALAKTKTKWIFRCFYGSNSGGGSGNNSSSGNVIPSNENDTSTVEPISKPSPSGNPVSSPNKIVASVIKKIPKLGDSNLVQIVLGISAIGLFVTWRPGKKRKKGQEDA